MPRRLHEQINQWISVYCGELVGQVIEELICRGRLEKPESAGTEPMNLEKPLVNGVFYRSGDFVMV